MRSNLCILFSLVILAILHTHAIFGLALHVINDPLDMAINKKICLSITCAPEELGIYRHALSFSVDSAAIKLLSWQAHNPAISSYSNAFKKTKKIFSGPLLLDVFSQTASDVLEQSSALFAKAHIHVSGLVAYHNGKVAPFNLIAPLKSTQQLGELALATPDRPLVDPVSLFSQESVAGGPALMSVPDFDKELDFIERLGALWRRLVDDVMQAATWSLLFVSLLISSAFWLLLIAKRRYYWMRYVLPFSIAWEREFRRLTIFLLAGALLYGLSFILALYSILALFALLCFCAMCYAYLFPQKETSFLHRFKALIGFILGILVMPLLVKAYLMYCGL